MLVFEEPVLRESVLETHISNLISTNAAIARYCRKRCMIVPEALPEALLQSNGQPPGAGYLKIPNASGKYF